MKKLSQKIVSKFHEQVEDGEVRFPVWLLNQEILMDRVVKISDADIKFCHEFANLRLEDSLAMYQRRNNANIDKIKSDIFTGAMGELGIYKFFKELGYNISHPDFSIYKKKDKSWDADMCIDGEIKIHCKTQSAQSAKLYGDSIILQYGRYGEDKLFKNRTENDYLAWATLNEDNTVSIKGVFSIPFIFDNNLVKEPKIAWLADTKRALYLADFKEFDQFNLP